MQDIDKRDNQTRTLFYPSKSSPFSDVVFRKVPPCLSPATLLSAPLQPLSLSRGIILMYWGTWECQSPSPPLDPRSCLSVKILSHINPGRGAKKVGDCFYRGFTQKQKICQGSKVKIGKMVTGHRKATGTQMSTGQTQGRFQPKCIHS